MFKRGDEREFVWLAFLVTTGTALGTGHNSALLPDLLLGYKNSMLWYYEMAFVTICINKHQAQHSRHYNASTYQSTERRGLRAAWNTIWFGSLVVGKRNNWLGANTWQVEMKLHAFKVGRGTFIIVLHLHHQYCLY